MLQSMGSQRVGHDLVTERQKLNSENSRALTSLPVSAMATYTVLHEEGRVNLIKMKAILH